MGLTSIEGGNRVDINVDGHVKAVCSACGAIHWFDEGVLKELYEGMKVTSADIIPLAKGD